MLLGAGAGAAVAQPAVPTRVRAVIDGVDGSVLHLTDRAGAKMDVTLAPNTAVTVIAPSSLAEVKPGSYIGTAALPGPDGSLRALEVQVFPERMRGLGEGSRPYDLQPESSMTNGTVGDVVGTDAKSLTVKYGEKQVRVMVAPGTPVITYEPGTVAMLTKGSHVLIFAATKAADGTMSADRVNVGKDGMVPPL